MYLDITGADTSDKANIQVYGGNGTNAQKFKFDKIDQLVNGTYIISSALSDNMVLDIEGNSMNDEANIQLYSLNYCEAQQFKIEYLNNGYYSISGVCSNKSLDVAGASDQPEANVWQYSPNGTDAQKWIIRATDDGYFNIISKCNNLYLDVYQGRAVEHNNIQMYYNNGTLGQKFKFMLMN